MQDNGLVFLPLPLLTALLGASIAVLIARVDWGSRTASLTFAALFALLSFSSTLVGFRFGYGVEHLILVQRLVPLFVGPLMYLGFAAFAARKERFPKIAAVHLGVALIIVSALLALPKPIIVLDWVISLSYLIYIVLLVLLWRQGPDSLIHAHLGTAQSVSVWILRGAFLLLTILFLDTAIALDFMLTGGQNASRMISYASIPIIGLLLAFIFVLPSMVGTKGSKPIEKVLTADDEAADLEEKAREFLKKSELYLEPDLSVQRLARRLHVPVRALSNAVNQTQNINVSQYVNQFRMEHAADLLRGTDESVAKVMAQSGFLTRSNFYREFQRMYGQSPAAYRAKHRGRP